MDNISADNSLNGIELFIKKQAKETRRIKSMLKKAGVSPEHIGILLPVIENTAMLKIKMDEISGLLTEAEPVSEYDHGGGQSGWKENPTFKVYDTLWRNYMLGMNKILDALPKRAAERERRAEKAQNVLEIVRSRHQKES